MRRPQKQHRGRTDDGVKRMPEGVDDVHAATLPEVLPSGEP